MFRPLIIVCALGLAAATPAPVDTSDPSRLFGARESVADVDISPSGRYVVYIAPAIGPSNVALVADLQSTAPARPILRSSGNPEHLRWCKFASDTRLICSVYALLDPGGVRAPFTRLVAVDADGSHLKELGQRASLDDERIRQFDGAILDWLPGDGNAVLMSREYVPEVNTTHTRMGRGENGLAVDRIDIRTLRATRVENPSLQTSSYMTDGRGKVRMREVERMRVAGEQLSSRTDYYYRTAGSSEWREFGSYDGSTGQGMIPMAIDGALDAAYVLRKNEGRFALYRIKLDATLASELIYAHPKVDVDDVVRIGRGSKVIGATFAEEARQTVYFDPEYARLAAALSKAIPNLPLVRFVGASVDGGKLLIQAGSDTDPGRYFVYERNGRKLNEILLARPELETLKLAPTRAIAYTAPDGASVPAYLTLPLNKEAKNLPAIVLPHGGPSARDELDFDWLTQFLVARGYAVLRPNFRGSAGYGDAWMARNGFRGWQTSIGDVTAGAKWLVSQGIADPSKMAILGWSYGGYAALQSGVTEPGLYRAIVAIAPVADLALLKTEAKGFTNARLVEEFVGSGPHVEQGSPARNARRISAPVLLFHGTRDLNVGVGHSRQMDRALRDAGKQSELVIFEGLEHDLGDSAARALMLRRIEAFLAANLGGPAPDGKR